MVAATNSTPNRNNNQMNTPLTTARPIAARIFQMVMLGNVTGLIIVLGFAWWSLELLESTSIEQDRRSEIEYFQHYGDKTKPHHSQSSQIITVFQPIGQQNREELPVIFRDIPVPFEGEIEFLGQDYSVVTCKLPEGMLYIAENLRLFEQREEKLISSILVLALIIFLTSLALAYSASRRISRPILGFTQQLDQLQTGSNSVVIPENFEDAEVNQIARAVNTLIRELEDNLKREKALVSMASHELRTPVAVILGAAGVIESRGQLSPEDQVTLQRIINAAHDMSDNIRSLLALVRKTREAQSEKPFDIASLLISLHDNYSLENPANAPRLHIEQATSQTTLSADKTIVRILLHNLISNALSHTHGEVRVILRDCSIDIIDEGNAWSGSQGSGLGLYIVSLACEALGWRTEVAPHGDKHSTRISFKP